MRGKRGRGLRPLPCLARGEAGGTAEEPNFTRGKYGRKARKLAVSSNRRFAPHVPSGPDHRKFAGSVRFRPGSGFSARYDQRRGTICPRVGVGLGGFLRGFPRRGFVLLEKVLDGLEQQFRDGYVTLEGDEFQPFNDGGLKTKGDLLLFHAKSITYSLPVFKKKMLELVCSLLYM